MCLISVCTKKKVPKTLIAQALINKKKSKIYIQRQNAIPVSTENVRYAIYPPYGHGIQIASKVGALLA